MEKIVMQMTQIYGASSADIDYMMSVIPCLIKFIRDNLKIPDSLNKTYDEIEQIARKVNSCGKSDFTYTD